MLEKLQRPTTREDLAGVLTQRWKTPSRLYSVWHGEKPTLKGQGSCWSYPVRGLHS